MFVTKCFPLLLVQAGDLDTWLNSQRRPGYGVRIASQCVIQESERFNAVIITTIDVWKLGDASTAYQTRTTIDDLPEEPSIDMAE